MHASIDERSKWRIFHGSLSVAARFEQLFSNFFRGLSRLLAAFPATLGTEFLLGLVSRVSTISQPILHFSHRVIDISRLFTPLFQRTRSPIVLRAQSATADSRPVLDRHRYPVHSALSLRFYECTSSFEF